MPEKKVKILCCVFFSSRSFEGQSFFSKKKFSLIDCISQASKGIIEAF